MNYCAKRNRRWVCTANSVKKQRECDHFIGAPEQIWCSHTDATARCGNLTARANSQDNPEPLNDD